MKINCWITYCRWGCMWLCSMLWWARIA